jgi:hypothetical protein
MSGYTAEFKEILRPKAFFISLLSANNAVILRSRPQVGVSKDGNKFGGWLHPSRRQLRGLLRMTSSLFERSKQTKKI